MVRLTEKVYILAPRAKDALYIGQRFYSKRLAKAELKRLKEGPAKRHFSKIRLYRVETTATEVK